MKKAVSLFLILVLFSSVFLFANSPVKAASDSYWLDILTNEVIGFRNNSVTITTASNASQVSVKIFDPTETEIYSQLWNGNETRQINIPAQADYGTYTLKASVDSCITTTWFTVLDVSGWNSAGFPYTRKHKGVNYKFFANGTILADNGEDVLNVDLSTLRALISNLNLNVNALYNSMNLLIRVTKGSFALDMTFSFIHTGCKFTINGTIDQARSFTFKMENPQSLKSLTDNIRAGSLVFDYGDLRKVAYAFSYNKPTGELTVNVPKTFWIDPTLYEDGFESGDLSEWDSFSTTSGYGNITVSTEQPYEGTYSCRHNISSQAGWTQAYIKVDFGSGVATSYIRLYVYVDAYSATGYLRGFMRSNGEDNGGAYLGLDSSRHLRLYYKYDTSWGTDTSSTTLDLDTWYCVELKTVIDGSSGEYRVYLNDAEVEDLTHTSLDTSANGNIDEIVVGLNDGYNCASTLFIDSVVVDDEYIGELGDSTIPTYSGLSTSTTVCGASCQFNATFNDDTALESSGQYQLGLNQSGSWVWDSAVNFSSTPETVSVTKTLTNTYGLIIGYQWNFTDNAGNSNNTGIQTLTTTADTYTVTLSASHSGLTVGETVTVTIAVTRATGVTVSSWQTNITNNGVSFKENYAETFFYFTEPNPTGHKFDVTGVYDNTCGCSATPICEEITVVWQLGGGGGGGNGDDGEDTSDSPGSTPNVPSTIPMIPIEPYEPEQGTISPLIAGVIGVCVVGLIGIVVYVDQQQSSGWKNLKKNKQKKVKWNK